MAAACPVAGRRPSRKGEHMVSVTSTRLPSGGRSEPQYGLVELLSRSLPGEPGGCTGGLP